tara:strand:+ start:352 stop:987 length:636 start_codon:yes stop_codon:yes gene_type:complete
MKELASRTTTSIILILLLYFTYIYNQLFYLLVLVISLFSFFEFYQLTFKIKKSKSERLIYLILALIYLLSVIFLIKLNLSEIKNLIFYFILICISSDIGGLVFGKIFKGRKLTKISPNKTYSGLYGSFITSYITMIIFYYITNLDLLILLVFTFSVCFLAQFGDLFFSYLKRKANVKDTGKMLPGHGGILDRVDGIIISVPINIFIYSIST